MSPLLRPLRRDAPVFFAAGQPSRATSRCVAHGRSLISASASASASYGGVARGYCIYSGGGGRSKQDEARKAVQSNLGQKKPQFEKWGVQTESRRQTVCLAAGGGGWSGGGGGWFRWFSSGGFWDAAKQTLLTVVGIIAVFFLIANFNVLVAAIVNSLLAVLRQIRRALSFIAHCVAQGLPSSAPERPPASLDSGNQAAVVVKDRVGNSAKERVLRKWGMD
ncbi:uncharacterized protein LOC107304926 [Oryza brachyantha]|uniref:uncharacterized protein LOC107304926 n=1 Tax=Oryza brachyantha TaxID=4533 RepID=UPI0007768C33|nr:uncharacterized protein LOC107304926 [Oryza brachyantha]